MQYGSIPLDGLVLSCADWCCWYCLLWNWHLKIILVLCLLCYVYIYILLLIVLYYLDIADVAKPEFNVPLVLYLCHESCPTSGDCFEMGGGWISQGRPCYFNICSYLHDVICLLFAVHFFPLDHLLFCAFCY